MTVSAWIWSGSIWVNTVTSPSIASPRIAIDTHTNTVAWAQAATWAGERTSERALTTASQGQDVIEGFRIEAGVEGAEVGAEVAREVVSWCRL